MRMRPGRPPSVQDVHVPLIWPHSLQRHSGRPSNCWPSTCWTMSIPFPGVLPIGAPAPRWRGSQAEDHKITMRDPKGRIKFQPKRSTDGPCPGVSYVRVVLPLLYLRRIWRAQYNINLWRMAGGCVWGVGSRAPAAALDAPCCRLETIVHRDEGRTTRGPGFLSTDRPHAPRAGACCLWGRGVLPGEPAGVALRGSLHLGFTVII